MLQRKLAQDSLLCYGQGEVPIDRPHTWAYQGKASQQYLCTTCGRVITKRRLKRETDPPLIMLEE